MPSQQPEQPAANITTIQRVKCDEYLPSPEEGASLLSEFLINFNTAFPLFCPYAIIEHLRKCYMGGSDGTALAWANTYIVFGIAYRLRAMSAAATPRDSEQAKYYLTHVISGLPEPSLALIQVLLGLSTLIQASSHSTLHALFVLTALHMMQCLTYNDDQVHLPAEDQGIGQQRRVFWIVFVMDTDINLLSNRPTTHHRDDIDAPHPEGNPQDATGAVTAADETWRVNIYSLRSRLALLQAEGIEQVLSVKARRTTP
ncbi:hypothetical protein K469DRAFT_695134 [Zopfia rhizophila CBS 207.26]|uniref:Xylanolytic transcriptional activator regulatory domain-containing protein n=1 Tax=Zopfia rhizophila CBS 207.26 TaxID=1314779 RepID=A0A6A6DKQ2_9PEZI|nr:hypothetical protein K469DRAFT_695134 [Zopfia rhizophila CBS 207.26]